MVPFPTRRRRLPLKILFELCIGIASGPVMLRVRMHQADIVTHKYFNSVQVAENQVDNIYGGGKLGGATNSRQTCACIVRSLLVRIWLSTVIPTPVPNAAALTRNRLCCAGNKLTCRFRQTPDLLECTCDVVSSFAVSYIPEVSSRA